MTERQRVLCVICIPGCFSRCLFLLWILFHWNSPLRMHFWYHHLSLVQSYLILHLLVNKKRQDFQTMPSATISVFQNHPWSPRLLLLKIWSVFHLIFNKDSPSFMLPTVRWKSAWSHQALQLCLTVLCCFIYPWLPWQISLHSVLQSYVWGQWILHPFTLEPIWMIHCPFQSPRDFRLLTVHFILLTC